MKRCVQFAVVVVVVCGALPWQSSLSTRASAQLPAAEAMPFELVKSVTIDDLSNGKLAMNEYVIVNFQLSAAFQADIFAPSVKKMMGTFGQVIPLEQGNRLILIDSVANLREIVNVIKKIENDDDPRTFTFKMQHVRAAVAADKLKMVLNNPNAFAGNPGLAQAGKAPAVIRPRPHTVTYDDATNMVFVSGPRDKINLAKITLTHIDKLNSIDVSDTQIVIRVPVANKEKIAEHIKNVQPPPEVARVIALKRSDANKVADLILDKLSNDPRAPMVKSDMSKNAIVVYGSPNQVEAVRLMIESVSGEKVQGTQGK